jgi:hypothetical protein
MKALSAFFESHADGQTDKTKLMGSFLQLLVANAPERDA